MEQEKQIEEISNDLYTGAEYNTYYRPDCNILAEKLYNAGYRKEIQGEWIKTEYDKGKFYFACSTNCGEALTEVEEKIYLTIVLTVVAK